MKALSKIFTGLLALFVVTEAHAMRWYSSSTGRWFSRDPIQEKGGLHLYAFVFNNPIMFIDPDGRKVQMCCRDINVNPALDCLAKICGKRHCWLKTDTKQAGMGPANAGPLPACPCGSATAVVDHSKETGATCYDIPNANEDCVNNELQIGKSLGPWKASNNCNSYAGDVAKKCGGDNICLRWTEICGPDFGCTTVCTQWAY